MPIRAPSRHPFAEVARLTRQHWDGAKSHGRGALCAVLDFRPEHVGGCASDVRSWRRLRPRRCVQALAYESAHELVPCRVKLHFIAAMAKTIENLQRWRIAIGCVAEGEHCGCAEAGSQRV
jgi:hypothetical protein